jgi:DNA primase
MKQTIQRLNAPEVAGNMEKAMEVMTHYKRLTEIMKEMAKRAGDRVVMKA